MSKSVHETNVEIEKKKFIQIHENWPLALFDQPWKMPILRDFKNNAFPAILFTFS